MDTHQMRGYASLVAERLAHPRLLFREFNRLFYSNLTYSRYDDSGIDVFEQDWDTLVILDACRLDIFKDVVNWDGEFSKRRSRAADTLSFLHANFDNRELHDTVYVTSNPQLYKHRDDIDVSLHDVVNVWREDGWDDETQTVLPETTTEYALDTYERHPDKRLIVHYMQPHWPFVEAGTQFDKREPDGSHTPFWRAIARGEVDVTAEELFNLYRENLSIALPHVERLVNALDGKTVVTSDHGNMFGERCRPFPIREWGHPWGVFTDELLNVPWLECEHETRREIVSEPPADKDDDVDSSVVRDRLQQLGYAE